MGVALSALCAVRRSIAVALLIAVQLIALPAIAQTEPPNPSAIDQHGVDLVTGRLLASETDVSIGPSDHRGVRFTRDYVEPALNGWMPTVPVIGGSYSNPIVVFNGQSIPFTTSGGVYVPRFQDGSSLNAARTIFTSADGTVIEFGVQNYHYAGYPGGGTNGLGTKITYPDGVVWTYHYNLGFYQTCHYIWNPDIFDYEYLCDDSYVARLSSITTSTGFQVKLAYASNTVSSDVDRWTWWTRTKVTALNNAVEYCDPAANSCSFSNTWPEATYSGNSVTGPGGGTTTYSFTSGKLSGIQLPGDSSPTTSFTYNVHKVASVSRGGGTWNYSYGTNTTTVTDPASQTRTANFNSGGQTVSQVAGGQTTYFSYCSGGSGCPAGLLQTTTMPEGNSVTYAYDARGNITSTTRSVKPGSTTLPATISTSATYPSTCTYPASCNKPTSTTDARSQITYYDWNDSTGQIEMITLPPDASNVRPETRFSYASVSARYLTAVSTYSNGPAMSAPTGASSCRVAAVGDPDYCVGTADEQVTTLAYHSGVAHNALPVWITTKAGNNTLVATTTIGRDNFGWVDSIDGPLSGTADKALFANRLDGQRQWEIGPDPDDGGSALFPAKQYVYRADGQIDYVQIGTVTAQSSSLTGWVRNNLRIFGYDSYHRKVREGLYDGGPTNGYQLVDYVYDTSSRVQCSILRMDPSQYGSLSHASSCTPGSGANGYDRVAYNHYDTLGRVWKVTTGYGVTGLAADEQISTFSNNGKLSTLTDAEGNMTTYEYDGHDRLLKTRFPSPTTDNTSSTTDYELVGYDANGNVTSFRTRAGDSLSMTYDNLNRLVTKIVPDRWPLDPTYTRDVFFGYDLLGGMTYARFDSTSGEGITNAFNALGQLTSTTTNMDSVSRTLSYVYDTAGNLTRLYHPDSNHIDYYHHGSGALYVSYLNAASPLVHPWYDAQGRMSYLHGWTTSGSTWGHWQAFGYDAVSRLSTSTNSLAGSSYDSTTTLSYNPASQIISRAHNNDAYAFTAHANVNRSYTPNGLNQYSAVGGTSFSYDGAGNLTSDGTNSYIYDIENRLVWRNDGTTGATMRYDPLGRLYEVYGTNTGTTRFLYDGSDLVAEYNSSGTLLRRYVHGEGAGDDPQVWFEGSGVTNGERRYLYSDERGSIVAVTDSSGNVSYINTYDEYGIPGSAGNDITTRGRFRYTGQAWIPEMGMYYYKARMYSPTLGRFMQTDPIGYGDGMNMYAYVRSDPVNGVDPTGTRQCTREEMARIIRESNGVPPMPNDIFVCEDRPGYNCDDGACDDFINPQQRHYGSDGSSDGDGNATGNRSPVAPGRTPAAPTRFCQTLNARALEGMAGLPARVTAPGVWNDPAALKFYQSTYRYNANDYYYAAPGLAAVVAAVGTLFPPARTSGTAGVGITGSISWALTQEGERYSDMVEDIQERLDQLQAQRDGTC